MPNPYRIGIALATALFLLGIAVASEATAASYWQCLNQWKASDAYDSCVADTVLVVENGTKCRIDAACTRDNGWQKRITQITVSPDQADDLVVCDGNLKVSSCD